MSSPRLNASRGIYDREHQQTVAHIRRTLDDLITPLSDAAYQYAALPLCVVAAAFSIGVGYESTGRTVSDFCARYHCQQQLRFRGWWRARGFYEPYSHGRAVPSCARNAAQETVLGASAGRALKIRSELAHAGFPV